MKLGSIGVIIVCFIDFACGQKAPQTLTQQSNEAKLYSFARDARLQLESANDLTKSELREQLQRKLRNLAFDSLKTLDSLSLSLSQPEMQIFANDTVVTSTADQSLDIVYTLSKRFGPTVNMHADPTYRLLTGIEKDTKKYTVSGKIIGTAVQTVPANRVVVIIEPTSIVKN